MKAKYFNVTCAVINTTDKAVLIQNDQTGDRAMWVPRTCLAWESDEALEASDMGGRDLESLKIVDWFARKHGLA